MTCRAAAHKSSSSSSSNSFRAGDRVEAKHFFEIECGEGRPRIPIYGGVKGLVMRVAEDRTVFVRFFGFANDLPIADPGTTLRVSPKGAHQ